MNSDAEVPLLEVKGLKTHLRTEHGLVRAVEDISFTVHAGATMGIVGESGCGKSMTALSIMRLLPSNFGTIAGGEMLFRRSDGTMVDLAQVPADGPLIRSIRGNDIAMIFQEPMSSLNPVYTIGEQIMEAVVLHQQVDRREARERAIRMLDRVGIPAATQRVDEYPHQLSGGMRQRVMIAMALSCNPRLLIADEPTTALDVTVQAQILELIKELQEEFQMALIIITHDLGVVRQVADEVGVMYFGRMVEQAPTRTILNHPSHPYTQALLRAVPRIGSREQLQQIEGSMPSAHAPRKGCDFAGRCPEAQDICHRDLPGFTAVGPAQQVRCWMRQPRTAAVANG